MSSNKNQKCCVWNKLAYWRHIDLGICSSLSILIRDIANNSLFVFPQSFIKNAFLNDVHFSFMAESLEDKFVTGLFS
jgi:hypothetical protein